jgi:hypothetical protein
VRRELRGDATGTKEVVAINYLTRVRYFLCCRFVVKPVVGVHQESGQKNNHREVARKSFSQVIKRLPMDGGTITLVVYMLDVVDKSNIDQVKQEAHQTQNDEKSFHPGTQERSYQGRRSLRREDLRIEFT